MIRRFERRIFGRLFSCLRNGMKLKKLICLLLVVLIAFPLLPSCKKDEPSEEPGETSSDTEDVVVVTRDLSDFQQSYMDDIVREVSAEDLVRDKAYVVDDAKLEQVIAILDYVLNSDEFRALVNTDLTQLSKKLTDLLYSDTIINFAVQYLYPLVEEYFAKVWAGLPERMEDLPTEVPVVKEALVTVDLHIDNIEKALASIEFYLFPTSLADTLPEQYAEVAQKLRQATTPSSYNFETEEMTTPWNDPVLYDADGKLDLHWGVTDKESFIEAISAALHGVEPLLMALISNKACDNTGVIGTGEGFAAVVGKTLKLDLTLDQILLNLTATPNSGYNNTVAPLFEALGVTAPDGDSFENLHDVAEKGLVGPIEALIAQVIDQPVSFILSALPNLAYLIESQMVVPLLSFLKTEINYSADAHYVVKFPKMEDTAKGVQKSEEPIKINVGEMINLEDMGVDISSLNAILKMATKSLDLPLPDINGGKLATLGQLVWKDTVRKEYTYSGYEAGKAAYIEANRADVLMFLFDYLFGAMKDKALVDKIMGMVGTDKLPELVNSIIDRVLANPENAISALVEMMIPQTYTEPDGIQWTKVESKNTFAATLYSAYWTHEKADYMVANLPSLIDNVLSVSKLEIAGITANSLSELVDGLIGVICKPATLNSLAEKISAETAKISLPSAVTDLMKSKLGLDLNYWSTYKADFAEGDREGFKKALFQFLVPAKSLLTFLLSNQNITVTLTGKNNASEVDFVTLNGYDAYTKALIPLFEALGATNLPSAEALKTDGDAVLSHMIDALFSILDGLKADPYNKLVVLIPNVLCFIKSGALTGAMENLLFSVNQVLDTIRPIYDLNLSELIKFDLRFVKTDPIVLLCGFLSDLMEDKLGVRVNFNFTTDILFNALNTGTVESYTSANGKTGYRVNAESINKQDMLTVIYDYLLKELLFSENTPKYLQFAKDKLSLDDKVYGYLEKMVPALKEADINYPGSGKALIFWVFFAAESLVGAMGSGGGDVLTIITTLVGSGSPEKKEFAKTELQKDMKNEGFSDILGSVLKPLFG